MDSAPSTADRRTYAAAAIVFVAAVGLRIPSCFESFWIDELHSAWTIWDEIGQVFLRADQGHQSPCYFVGLWVWKQLCGESELALRMSSVLAVSLACGVVTTAVARWSKSMIAGITGGMVLAFEENSIFFGTELRPYSFVVLFSTCALACFLELVSMPSRHDGRNKWSGLIGSVLLAALCQPTSLGVLIWLPVLLCIRWLWCDWRSFFRCTLTDCLLAVAMVAVMLWLWQVTLGESWNQRTAWSSFAKAESLSEVWHIWDWFWLWCLPLLIVGFGFAFARSKRLCVPDSIFLTLVLLALTLSATLLFWSLSLGEAVHLWHRRYLIAVLPMFAVIAGGSIAAIVELSEYLWRQQYVAGGLALVCVVGLVYRQDMHHLLLNYPRPLVARGEDWRGAAKWIQEHSATAKRIYLDSQLVELYAYFGDSLRAKAGEKSGLPPARIAIDLEGFSPRSSRRQESAPREAIADQLAYLNYPLLGPYAVDLPIVSLPPDLEEPPSACQSRDTQLLIVTRRSSRTSRWAVPRWSCMIPGRTASYSFGGVTVVSAAANHVGSEDRGAQDEAIQRDPEERRRPPREPPLLLNTLD